MLEFSRAHEAILFAHRGTGSSSKTVMQYATAMFAADTAAILDEVGTEQAMSAATSTALNFGNVKLAPICTRRYARDSFE